MLRPGKVHYQSAAMLQRHLLTKRLLPLRSSIASPTTPRPRNTPLHSIRTLATTRPTQHPIANPVDRPDLLQRNSDRPLPTLSSLSSTRQWIRTLPIFFLIITVSALGIFNYQKVNSSIITATLYSLRTNPTVREELGDEVYFASKWAWIWGEINLVQGRVDVKFSVKGTKRRGVCRFRAKRVGGRSGIFKTLEWSLTMDEDGSVIQLLDPERDPLQGTGV